MLEEEHEVSIRRCHSRRKRAHDSAAGTRRRSTRLAAKEDLFHIDATSKATHVKAAQLDLARASARMKEALANSSMLQRPAPPKIASNKLRCLGRVCSLPNLSDAKDVVTRCYTSLCVCVVFVLLEDCTLRYLIPFFM